MKVIIAGSRTVNPEIETIEEALKDIQVLEVVSGGAYGVDSSGEDFARKHNILIKRFIPDWDRLGKRAGPLRNASMAAYGDILLLIWDGKSAGSRSMKSSMIKLGKPVIEIIVKE